MPAPHKGEDSRSLRENANNRNLSKGALGGRTPVFPPDEQLPQDLFTPSDFGVEIGGRPIFENLPRSTRRSRGNALDKVCVGCHRRRALFRYRNQVRFDRDHNFCFRCYRSAMDQLMAMLLRG
jgi:hypothetical protein